MKTEIDRSVLERILDDAAYIKQEDRQAIREAIAAPVPPAGDVEVLVVVTLGGYFSSEELGDIDIEPRMGALEQLQQDVVRSDSDEHVELVDRAHVTRLTAERDGLLAEVARYKTMSDNYCALNMDAQSELTKARELLAAQGKVIEWAAIIDKQAFAKGTQNVGVTAFRAMGDALAELARQPATLIAHNVDESCGQDAEAAKGEPEPTCNEQRSEIGLPTNAECVHCGRGRCFDR